ncbi:hypothetical protein P3W24_08985 [Luteibacter sp. PPL201]|uniref:Alpha/beta hydrolase n=1 Tax=Luteibacter sahnii TaxID=3021977 RepID=A0ABT6BAD7_9GAMM
MKTFASLMFALCGMLAASGAPAEAGPRGDTDAIQTLRLADGDMQRILVAKATPSKGTIVMLPGGEGDVGLHGDGDIRHGHNVVVRTRALWNAHGYSVVIPDTIDHANLRGQRSTPAYGQRVEELIAYAHAHVGGPVFLLGTSQGAIAAMNGAAHAPEGRLAGLVLTESVSVKGGSGETVFDADPAHVRVPALVVANRDDRCDVAPPGNAPRIAASMTSSPDVHVLEVSGGVKKSDRDCGSLTPHGYFGIESEVVSRIASWLDAHRQGTAR